jgi:hypothetical protein
MSLPELILAIDYTYPPQKRKCICATGSLHVRLHSIVLDQSSFPNKLLACESWQKTRNASLLDCKLFLHHFQSRQVLSVIQGTALCLVDFLPEVGAFWPIQAVPETRMAVFELGQHHRGYCHVASEELGRSCGSGSQLAQLSPIQIDQGSPRVDCNKCFGIAFSSIMEDEISQCQEGAQC